MTQLIKSHFWRHDEWRSRGCRARNTKRTQVFTGPIYFETEIDEKDFRKWIRETYKINCTKHISVKVSTIFAENEKIKRAFLERKNKKVLDENRLAQSYKHWREARQSIMLQKILGKKT